MLTTGLQKNAEDDTIYYQMSPANLHSGTVPLWQHLLTLPISSQCTVGLAKICNFEILTHGTSIKNAMGIMQFGADPSKGGSSIGSTHFYTGRDHTLDFTKRTRDYFYVFKDTEARVVLSPETIQTIYHKGKAVAVEAHDKNGSVVTAYKSEPLSLGGRLELFVAPRFHAALSGIAAYSETENSCALVANERCLDLQIFYFLPQYGLCTRHAK